MAKTNLDSTEPFSAICLDMGTTNSRAWLVCGDEIIARATSPIGIRVTASERSRDHITKAVKEMIDEVRQHAGAVYRPQCIAAAGMITSDLGLKEVPHVPAPAGLVEIAAGSQWNQFPDIAELPSLLVPGVRTLAADNSTQDVMRGEETLCVGLVSSGDLNAPGVVLNLGSHWKAIEVDSHERISSSVTSLSGELIDVSRTRTILASSLPQEFPDELAWQWVEAGMAESRQTGLPRTLFRVRLLELNKDANAEDRLAFLVGAVISSDLDALVARGMFTGRHVVLSGHRAVAECWRRALQQKLIPVSVLSANDTERAFLKGLQRVVSLARTETFKSVLA